MSENLRDLCRKILASGCLWTLFFAAAPTSAQPQSEAAGRVDALRAEVRSLFAVARDRVFPALVSIETITVSFHNGAEVKGRAFGSGTIISQQGHVVTNQHVVANGIRFRCTLADKQVVDAELIGEDPLTDLAVLRLLVDDLDPANKPLPVAAFGDSDALEIGDYVMAMGSPFSLARSVTLGIVSNTERVFGPEMGRGDLGGIDLEGGQRTGLFTRWIQHDAAIYSGNSGGPLIDLAGEIVGVNELGGSGLGFAIPSRLVRSVVPALIEQGEVLRSWIGVTIKPIPAELEQGALINLVMAESPAEHAGLRVGDVLLGIDGQPVDVRFPEDVPLVLQRIAERDVGSEVLIAYQRDGHRLEARLRTEKLERDRGRQIALRRWGLVLQELTRKSVADHLLVSRQGALVTAVRSGSPAARSEPRLLPGDLLLTVRGTEIADLETISEHYQDLVEDESTEDLVLEFERRGKRYLSLLRPNRGTEVNKPAKIQKAWLGVVTQPFGRSLAERLGQPPGLRLIHVYPGTEAAKAGLRAGDIVLAVAETPLRARDLEDGDFLARRIRSFDIGEQIVLEISREGHTQKIPVVLEAPHTRPEEAQRYADQNLELTVRELTFFDRDEYRWGSEVRGVMVAQAVAVGAGSLGGIRPGDLLEQFGDWPVDDLASFEEAVQALERLRPESVEIVVRRGARTFLEHVRLEWEPVSR